MKDEIVEVKGNEISVTVDEDRSMELSKTYNFEGEKISVLDFAGLEDITANDMIKANKMMLIDGAVAVQPENDLYYSLLIAAMVTGMPIEFFKSLHPRDAIRIKTKVTNFFFGVE